MRQTLMQATPLTTVIAIHMTAALAALVLGPVALWARRGHAARRVGVQRPRLHRAAGYAWTTCILAAAVSALFIRDHDLPNIAGYPPIHLFVPFTLLGLYSAFRELVRGNIQAHRKHMLGLCLGACVTAGLFTLLPSRALGQRLQLLLSPHPSRSKSTHPHQRNPRSAVESPQQDAKCRTRSSRAGSRYELRYITMRTQWFRWLLTTALAGAAWAAPAGEVTVAVAANFTAPLERIGSAFAEATGHRLKVSAGATGKFYSQIVAGAPFEVLLAADDETPQRLAAGGHALAETRFTYAVGRLVLWSAQAGLVDEQGAVLMSPRISKIAIANPQVAPYGAAALEVIRAQGLADRLKPKLVMAASIAQAFQFVSTGNAEIGFVALSQVTGPDRAAGGSLWRIPGSMHREIRQDAVLLKRGAANPAAIAFMTFLKSPGARAIIRSYGYGA